MERLIEEEENKYKKERIETSKLIAIYLFVLLNTLVIYSMIAMWVLQTSPISEC